MFYEAERCEWSELTASPANPSVGQVIRSMADASRMNTLTYGSNCFKLRMQRDSNDQPSTSRLKGSLFIRKVTRKSDRKLTQKLAKKRYISNIRNDPELYELEKEKGRQRYLRRKNNKEITSIDQKSPQQPKSQRKNGKKHLKYIGRRKNNRRKFCLYLKSLQSFLVH